MLRLIRCAFAVCVGSLAVIGLQAGPTQAATTASKEAVLVGELGFEGGAYPGGFHLTAGSVIVQFNLQPLVLDHPVGTSGHFRIPLTAGKYTVSGCGPSSSSSTTGGLCSEPVNITLTPGEVDHIKLVWAYAP